MGVKRSGSAAQALAELRKKLGNGDVLRVGFLENARYPDGQYVADVAYQNEFGRPDHNQPPRPFFRIAIRKGKANWAHNFGVALKATDYNLKASFALVGEDMVGTIVHSINALTSPPLAPSTIARKGFDKPLINTAHMTRSVAYDVQVKP